MHKINLNQRQVMNQLTGAHGHQTCAYHTFKNALLSLMHIQGLINEIQLNSMLNDTALFKAIFDATKIHHPNGDVDLSLPVLMELLQLTKEGKFNFEKHGITKEHLKQLRITPDGTQGITGVNFSLYPEAPAHGLGGMEEDLLVAAATVKLARTKDQANHVFAVGLNNVHWVTAAVTQNERGVRSWQFMDSYNNQQIYKDSVVRKIESVLSKSEPELQKYLRQAYINSSDLFFRRYQSFFDQDTGLPLAKKVDIEGNQVYVNAKEFFIDQKITLELFAIWIEHRVQFMESAGWLTSIDGMEQLWVKQLHNLTRFMVQNTSATHPQHMVVRSKLLPIFERLNAAQPKEQVIKKPDVQPVITVVTAEAEARELAKIRNNAFDIKGHFKLLFDSTLAKKASPDKVQVVDSLVDENTLSAQLKIEYPGKDYVVMFYAHKPHSSDVSPVFPDEDRAHTSVLLCKVNNNKIEQILNVDGYNYTGYVDILGERPGATRNSLIQQRLVIQPIVASSGSKTPLQRASWRNMNCVLYSFTFVERIVELFNEQPNMMSNLFPADKTKKVTPESLFFLEEGILEGLVGKYIKEANGNYVYDDSLKDQHHNRLRELLASQYALKCAADRQAQEMSNKPVQDTLTETVHEPVKKPVQNTVIEPVHQIEVPTVINSQTKPSKSIAKDPGLLLQQQATIDAVKHGTPKATEGFTDRFVNAIKWILEAIKDAFVYVGQKMGLVS